MTYINKELQAKFGFIDEPDVVFDGATKQKQNKPRKTVPHRPTSLPKVDKTPLYKRKLIYAILIILLIVAWQPTADWYAVASATPAQKTMADNIALTSKGRSIFLATKPELLDTSSFSESCPSQGTNDLEEGCYIPNTNRIYVRVMPEELKSDETVTAAHEMLHAAYQKYDEATLEQIDSMVEAQYSSMNDSELNARVAEYNKTEPGAQDDELYAILGTEYPSLSTNLEAEYSKYFTNREVETSAAAQTKSTFDDYTYQLNNQKNIIDNEQSAADKYYAASVSWANAGNAYQDDYYYNLYSNEYDNASRDIDSYNQLVDKYNLLVDEYNGEAYTPLTQTQMSSQ